MITEQIVDSKKTRAFGWIQDASDINSLYNVVSIFDSESMFHKKLVEKIIPKLVSDIDGKNEMLEVLSKSPVEIKYKMLIGSSFTPRSSSRCNGIIQASVKGQKRDFIGDWPADNYLRWILALGFVKYNYSEDSFKITQKGLKLTRCEFSERKNIISEAILSYPPAYRILSLLNNPKDSMTKFELGEKLGFTGEDGFLCYPVNSIVAALSETSDKTEQGKIRSDWESSSDKYARQIAQWLEHLDYVKNCRKEITVLYGNKVCSSSLSAFCITPQGERILRNIAGNSKHSKIKKNVCYEMFSTKGSDREYLRLRRSYILKYIIENKNSSILQNIQNFLKTKGIQESTNTINDDVLGFINLGLNIEIKDGKIVLKDLIEDFVIPVYKDLTKKSQLAVEKDEVRKQLKSLSHDYLALIDIAFDPSQNRLFEIKTMDLFLNECGFFGIHLGGANKPDGVIYTDDDDEKNYGIIVDMKAYSKGYNLPIAQQDEMKRYISNNQKKDEKINSTKWWSEFPEYVKQYYFMFVSGCFKGEIEEKLNNIFLETNVKGIAVPIIQAILLADKIKSDEFSRKEFEQKINNAVLCMNE